MKHVLKMFFRCNNDVSAALVLVVCSLSHSSEIFNYTISVRCVRLDCRN